MPGQPEKQGSVLVPGSKLPAELGIQVVGSTFQGTDVNVGNNNISIGTVHGNVQLSTVAPPTTHPKSVRIPLADWLSPLDFGRQQAEALERRTEGTFNWLLETHEFTTWKATENGEILLCIGKPGAGKTTFASFVIDHLQQQHDADSQNVAAVCYIYCRYYTTFTLLQLLELVLKQLILQCPSANIDRLQNLKDQGRRPTVDELASILQANFSQIPNVFIVIDAMDECFAEGVRHRLLSTLQSWNSVKVLITSRPIPTIESALPGATILIIFPNTTDIGTHIRAQTRNSPNLTRLVPKVSSTDLETKVVARAGGMFLLVELHIKHLSEQTNVKAFLNALEALPNEASATYARALERINQQNSEVRRLAVYALSWIFHAQRPLKMIELQYGIASTRSGCPADESDLDDEGLIISSCAGLLVMNQDTRIVTFIHYTVQEYIEQVQGDFLPKVEITRCCMSIISSLTEVQSNPPSNPLIEYAAHFWGRLVQSAKDDDSVIRAALSNLEAPAQFATIWAATVGIPANTSASDGRDPHPLHLVAALGIDRATQILLEKYPLSAGDKDPYGRTPLHLAARGGHAEVVNMLLDAHVDVDPTNSLHQTPLLLAAQSGHSHVAAILLRTEKINVNVSDLNRGFTPLLHSAWEGHLGLVHLLLEVPNIAVDARGKYGESALSLAAKSGNVEIVKALLALAKIEVNAKDNRGWTPLHGAAQFGHSEIVQLLLDNTKVDADTKDTSGRSPLSSASTHGHMAVVKHEVDISAVDEDGRTPLWRAAENGHLELVKLFGEKAEHDIDRPDKFGTTPLAAASSYGHFTVVEFLINTGKVDISAVDEYGRTPLWGAAVNGHLELVELLGEKAEHDIDHPDKFGITPLTAASSNGHFTVVELLINTGKVDISAVDEDGRTPLWGAAKYGHLELVKLLGEKAEHDIDRPDNFGTTPLAAASSNGHFTVVEFLVCEAAHLGRSRH